MENRTNLTFLIDLVTHWVLILFYRELSIFFIYMLTILTELNAYLSQGGGVIYNLGNG